MFEFIRSIRMKFIYLLLSGIILTTACKDDDPLTAEEDHFEAIGTVVYDASGALALSILRGETNDTLHAESGELSDHFTVKFYDEDENIVEPPDNDHTSMGYEVADEAIVAIYQHEGEEGEFEFHLQGISEGVTSIELFVKHEGHNDYRSGSIPVVVK